VKILESKELTRCYTVGGVEISVLEGVSLSVEAGEFLVVKGSSGSGKSTLLSLLSGLDRPTRGQVILDGADITHWSEDRLAPLRNEKIGFVFQGFHLVPSLTALENVAFPAELKGDLRATSRALDLLRRVGMEARKDNFPHQLSGGEKQRAAICRALVNRPRIVFADEPTGNLDSVGGQAVLDLLLELRRQEGATLLMVTHSMDIARSADRIVLLEDGRIQGEIPPHS